MPEVSVLLFPVHLFYIGWRSRAINIPVMPAPLQTVFGKIKKEKPERNDQLKLFSF